MHLCYIDEAGNGQTLAPAHPDAPPVLVVGGFAVPRAQLAPLARDFLDIKKKYRPQLRVALLTDVIQQEIKGADVRKDVRSGKRNARRGAIGLLDAVLELLHEHEARLLARIWVKEESVAFDETRVYSYSVRALNDCFQALLAHEHSRGMMVLDSRTKAKNAPNVHGVTTGRFRREGDRYRGLIESPVFGHSDTHVLLQLADLVVSSLLFPIACHSYLHDLE